MSDHTQTRLQIARHQATTVWAHVAGQGATLVADFGVGKVRRDLTKSADARRAVACWNLCMSLSTEQIEEAVRHGATIDAAALVDMIKRRQT